jgi:hypothetical protein
MSRRRTQRALRGLAFAALLVLLLPIAGLIGTGLARDRDLAAAWRAWRAPAPKPVATPVPVAPAPFGPALYVGRLLDPPPSKELADALAPEMLHMPTALDLAPDGSAAVVLSYAAGWRFPRGPDQGWAEAFAGQPERIALPPLALAEAVAYVGASLFVTSEVDRLSLVRWRAPLVRFDPVAPAGDGR